VELANVIRDLRRYWVLVVIVIAIAAAGAAMTQQGKSLEYGAAQTQMLIDAPKTPVVNLNREFDPLVSRAAVYAQLMTSAPIKNAIGREAGVPGASIVASAPVEADQPKALKEPGAEQRANQILGEKVPLRLFFASQPEQPIITISSQAPTGEGAVRLANAAVIGFQRYIADIQEKQNVPQNQRVIVEQLGPAAGGLVNEGASMIAAALAFFALLIGGILLVLFIANVRRGMNEPGAGGGASVDWDGELRAADLLDGDRLDGPLWPEPKGPRPASQDAEAGHSRLAV
jgi:hypothetical protein